jgi:hypothetical protein
MATSICTFARTSAGFFSAFLLEMSKKSKKSWLFKNKAITLRSKGIIVDYSQYVEDDKVEAGDIGVLGGGGPSHMEFFEFPGWCPFCSSKAGGVFQENYYKPWAHSSLEVLAWVCEGCGWWQVLHKQYDSSAGGFCRTQITRNAIVRRFESSDANLPMDMLRKEIKRKPDIIYDIHHKKMEQLVQSIFSEFYKCEVKHCGKSHDGGIDLMIVNSNHPVLIQVKRRTTKISVEPISTVREFLGATLLANGNEAIFVTTADHFSQPARKAAQTAIREGLINKFELIDLHSFLDMLNAVQENPETPVEYWRRWLPVLDVWKPRRGKSPDCLV